MTDEEAIKVFEGAEIMCLNRNIREMQAAVITAESALRARLANEPLTCKGCEYQEIFENEREYGYPSPCNACIRVAFDNYRRKPKPEGSENDAE